MVYVYGLVAACLLGLGFVLQQHAAERAPLTDLLSFRLLLDLVRVPLWLGGIGCMVVGQILSARHLPFFEEPPLLTAAAGALYGLQDALTQVSSGILSDSASSTSSPAGSPMCSSVSPSSA